MSEKLKIKSRDSFTLVELVVVLGILAILAAVTVIVIRPDQLFKQTRDTQRLSDLESINKALLMYRSVEGSSYGTANIVYTSLPDNSSTCGTYSLPALPDGWTYSCKTATNYRKTDGTGWIPVDFTSVSTSVGQMFAALPIDPINDDTGYQYYTYMTGGSWEMTASLESDKFKMGGGSDSSSTDGGRYPELYEKGTDLSINPVNSGDLSLVGYWKFDEGTGTSAYDASGHGNTGTLTNHATYGSAKVGSYAASFDGTDDYVNCGTDASLKITGSITISAWIYPENLVSSSHYGIVKVAENVGSYQTAYALTIDWQNNIRFYKGLYADLINQAVGFGNDTWYHVAATHVFSTSQTELYYNGQLVKSGTFAVYVPTYENNNPLHIANGTWGYFNGHIDDVHIYNRVLSAAEILALYNATK
ncbi:MAG: prepilin-type N-terminal cleavage/methylation domain-containing protein [Candidatus Pacebacteria bacterium]|nr:prepilin-type N-terminal cleavage/methylation domain-containing protein [Candidatus Paceibacterota bacterium]